MTGASVKLFFSFLNASSAYGVHANSRSFQVSLVSGLATLEYPLMNL